MNDVLKAAIEQLGLTMSAAYIPWSRTQQASADPKLHYSHRSFHWTVTLTRNNRNMTCPYTMGSHYCIWFDLNGKKVEGVPSRVVIAQERALIDLFETGKCGLHGKATPPDIVGVMYCLLQDASVLDFSCFEDWAGEYGYDLDSRQAEKVYKNCLEHALQLRQLLGEENIRKLNELYYEEQY